MAREEKKVARTSGRKLLRRLLRGVWPYRYAFFLTIILIVLQSIFTMARVGLAKFLVDDVIIAEESPKKVEIPSGTQLPGWLKNTGERLAELKETIFQAVRGDGGPEKILLRITIFAALLALGLAVVGFLSQFLQNYLILRINANMRAELFAHLLVLEVDFFARRKGGDLLSRITHDLMAFEVTLRFLFSDLIVEPFTILAALITALWLNPLLTMGSLCIGPPLYAIIRVFGKKVKRRARKRQRVTAEFVQAVAEAIGGIKVIKAFDADRAEIERFHKINDNIVKHSLRVNWTHTLATGLVQLLNNLLVPLLLFVGGHMLLSASFDLKPGELVFFLGLLITVYRPFKALTRAWNTFQESLAGAERVYEVLDRAPRIVDAPDAVDLPCLARGIEFDRVSFTYPGTEARVLKDLSFRVEKGDVVALVGPSGAGKSTILSLIPRFYDSTGGEVLIEGIPVRKIRRSSLLKRMALVTQDPFLFNATIEENLRYGAREATREDMLRALRDANFQEVLEKLPHGIQTTLGDRGANLSGGERQRLTIARALLRDPEILLLDEATASLDSHSEKQVQDALERLMEGRTTLVIAHRLATIRNADRIVVIAGGRVVQSGTHDELIEAGGLYSDLHAMQFATSSSRTEA